MLQLSKKTEVDVPVAPMLDMAFQLLTFFVLTYRPAPAEGQFSMNFLPAAPVLAPDATAPPDSSEPADLPAAVRTLTTTLRAGGGGELASIQIGENEPMNSLEALRAQLREIFGGEVQPFEQVLLTVDPRLSYADLIKVIDVFSSLNINKIAFEELPDTGGPPL